MTLHAIYSLISFIYAKLQLALNKLILPSNPKKSLLPSYLLAIESQAAHYYSEKKRH